MPRVVTNSGHENDPWGHCATDSSYYKAGKGHLASEKDEPSWIAPMLAAIETALFAAGPEGVLVSAGLSLAFQLLTPTRAKSYSSSFSLSVLKSAIAEGLRSHDIQHAVRTLKDFHRELESMEIFSEKIGEDDYTALDDSVMKRLHYVVGTDGPLLNAFNDLVDNFRFDGDEIQNHLRWIAVAVMTIFQAYWIRCSNYSLLARQRRNKDDFHGYNSLLGSLRWAFDNMKTHIPTLIERVNKRLQDAIDERLSQSHVEFDSFDVDFGARLLGSGSNDSAYYASHIKDDWTGQRLTVGRLTGKDYSDGVGIKSKDNDDKLRNWANECLSKYKEELRRKCNADAKPLTSRLEKLRRDLDKFVNDCRPTTPKKGPLPSGYVHMSATSRVPKGTYQSFRIVLVDGNGKPLPGTEPSPWSKWVVTRGQDEAVRLLVPDGYATTDVHRQIYLRARAPHTPPFDIAGERGVLVDTIYGHGLILWPEAATDQGSI